MASWRPRFAATVPRNIFLNRWEKVPVHHPGRSHGDETAGRHRAIMQTTFNHRLAVAKTLQRMCGFRTSFCTECTTKLPIHGNIFIMETKKFIVSFSISEPERQSSDFVVPWTSTDKTVFIGLKSRKEVSCGLVVYIGKAITESDILSRMADSGLVMNNMDNTIAAIRTYIKLLQALKIGNVVRLASSGLDLGPSISIELLANTPSAIKI